MFGRASRLEVICGSNQVEYVAFFLQGSLYLTPILLLVLFGTEIDLFGTEIVLFGIVIAILDIVIF